MFECPRGRKSVALAVGPAMRKGASGPVAALAALCIVALLGAGCATTARLSAVPLSLAGSAVPLNIADARYYADTDKLSALATQSYNRGLAAGLVPAKSAAKHPTRAFLAISAQNRALPLRAMEWICVSLPIWPS